MLAEVNTSRPAIENGALSDVLDPSGDGVGLGIVVQPVQEDRELVAAQPGQRVALPQAGLETPRRGDQQLVADHVAETVVDDLEAVEIEVEDGEAVVNAAAPALVEPPAEPLDEHGAIGQAGQRVDEADAAQPLLRDRLLGRVGERPGDPIGLAALAAHGDAAAEEAAVDAVLVADPVLVLEDLRRARRDASRARHSRFDDVVGMDAIEPFAGPPIAACAGSPIIARQRAET